MQKQKTGTVRIYRPDAYFGVVRGLHVRIDGEKVASVCNGDSVEVLLPAGDYSVSVHMDWCRSPAFEFHLMEGQILQLRAEINGGSFGALLHSVFDWHNLYRLVPIVDKSKQESSGT